jgi:hypothetical protein
VCARAVAFAVLTGLNFIRNAQYYKSANVTNPFEMNLYQIGAYLGTPMQVSVGVADAVMRATWELPGDPIDSFDAARPTFLIFKKIAKVDGNKEAEFYGYEVELESNFTTNSVFADTYAVYGVWGWVYTMGLYAIAGYLFARLVRYGFVVAGSAGVMAHSLSEVWRTQNVNYGFVIFLVVLTIASAVVADLCARRGDKSVRT